MTEQIARPISDFLRERISAGDFPSAVYLVADQGKIIYQDALGAAVKTDEIEIPARLETIYDLASLTKVLVTGLLWAKFIENGAVELDDEVCVFFKDFAIEPKWEITIENLLTHTSGFVAWKPFYLSANKAVWQPSEIVFKQIVAEPLENPPDAKVIYSDFNFLMLYFLLEELQGEKFEAVARQDIFEPLNLKRTFFNPPKEFQNEIAACEFGNEYEKQISIEQGFKIRNPQSAIRSQLIWGEVHDGNCYFMNGVSGHAGLFSTAAEVFKIALQFLPRTTQLLKPETCDLFKTNFTRNLNEARSFAFELAETPNSTASRALASNSFGHLGFTGTSLWIEPETERIFILLTNRTHRALPFVNINSTRRRFHELAVELLNAK